MPGKSRRWHPPQSKRGKGRRSRSVTVTHQQPVAQSNKPVSRPEVSAPPVSVPAPMSAPMPAQTVVHYPYIVTELRAIGILAGVMLAILVILALVLA